MGTPRPNETNESHDDVVGTLCIDGQPLTEADIEKVHADRLARITQTRRAVIAVAAFAADRNECAELLAMLGFDTDEVASVRDELRLDHSMPAARAS